jgi:ABC-type transport system substrate-binding protein
VAACLALAASACGGGGGDADAGQSAGDETKTSPGGEYSVSVGDLTFLSPAGNCYESECSLVLTTLMEPLWEVDSSSGELTMRAAESIESDDQKTWTLTLRPDQTFHNGEPVNADAYIRAWNATALGANGQATNGFFAKVQGYAAMNPEDPNPDDDRTPKPDATTLSGLKKVDDLTIQITLEEPFSQWPLLMSYTPAFAPLAKECADITACQDNPIGTGPYMMAEPWARDRSIQVTRFEAYNGDDPGTADAITFRIYKDLGAAYKDFQAGNLDLVNVLPDVLPQAREDYSDNLVQMESSSFTYMGFPLDVPAFKDANLRRAISMAFDREAIVSSVLNDSVEVADDVISPIVPGYEEDSCEYCRYDPDAAKKLWAENGGADVKKLTLYLNSGAGHEPWVEAMGNQIEANLGVSFTMQPLEWSKYLDLLLSHNFDGPYRLGWQMDYPSPENYIQPLYADGGHSNFSGFHSDRVQDLLQEGDRAGSIEEGLGSYREAADEVLDQLPVLPMFFGISQWAYSDRIVNVQLDATDTVLLREVGVSQ